MLAETLGEAQTNYERNPNGISDVLGEAIEYGQTSTRNLVRAIR